MKLTRWQYRILKLLGIAPFSRKAQDTLAGLSKHGRGKQRSPYADERRRKKRKMAKASRRVQRPRYTSKPRSRGRRNRLSSRSWR